MNKKLTIENYLRIRRYMINAICALPLEERNEGYQVMDILVELLSYEDLQKVVEITYNEHINQSAEV